MRNSIHLEMEPWRVILLRRNASELLAFQTEFGLSLPRVEIPMHTRVAEALNREIKMLWDLDVYSLYPLPTMTNGVANARCHLVEALQHNAVAPQTGLWVPIRDGKGSQFADSADTTAVQAWIHRLDSGNANGNCSPFERPGWLLVLQALVQEALQTISLKLNGHFVQFNASPSFSLIRFETDSDAVWFKAVGEPNEREFSLTVALSSLLPSYTPRVIATQPLWNAWTALEVPGNRLSQSHGLSAWCNAARDLARMQVASIEMTDVILDGRPRDVRIGTLVGQVAPFFARLRELMDCQPTSPPARLSRQEISQLEQDTYEALLTLQRERFPDALGHLDLNPENIIAAPGRTVFLDWAEGSVGHPLFSFAYLLEHFRSALDRTAQSRSRLVREYAGVWESARSIGICDKTLAISTFLAVFVHAVSTDTWRDDALLQQPGIAGYYRSLARRMKRYAERVGEGSSGVWELFA
jgi:Phosphotransferase enzyme family